MNLLKCNGIVLKESKTKDNDKVIKVYTKEYGKLSFYIKDTKHSIDTNIFNLVEILFRDGVNLKKVNGTYLIENFYDIRNDIEKFTNASYFLELVEEVTEEAEIDEEFFKFLYFSFKKFEKYKNIELFRVVFEMRLLKAMGIYPNFFTCGKCDEEGLHMDIFLGSVLCEKCKTGTSFEITKATRAAYIYILNSELKDIYAFNVSDKVLSEMKKLNQRFIDYNLNKEFKSLNFLNLL